MKPNPVWLAVDTAVIEHARSLVAAAAPHIGGVKLGLEFFVANGPEGVARMMGETGLPLFLDLKLHDIPNTVSKAVKSAMALKPALLTIHAAGGSAMIRAARDSADSGTRIIAVTVLTSMDDADLAETGISVGAATQVQRLGALVRAAGGDGIVCSPHEVPAARIAWPDGFFVVPGVRPEGDEKGDQKRVMTPAEALSAGASALVIGRPISAASDPAAAAAAIAASL